MTVQLNIGPRRSDIVTALNGLPVTVAGQVVTLAASLDQPAVVERYQTWPVWDHAVPFTTCLAETFWHVIVVLPAADQPSTIDAADSLVSTVADALLMLGQITMIRPARLILGAEESVPVIEFDLTI